MQLQTRHCKLSTKQGEHRAYGFGGFQQARRVGLQGHLFVSESVRSMVGSVSQAGASRAGLASAKEPAEAQELAQQSCIDTDGNACQVAYEECAKPVYKPF